MFARALLIAAVAPCSAFTIVSGLRGGATRAAPTMAEIGDTGVAFEAVARVSTLLSAPSSARVHTHHAASPRVVQEWRCKYSPGESGGPGDSASLKACNDLLTEYLPKLKELPGAEVTRQVCGGCMDFKVSITQPLAEHGAWAEADYNPLCASLAGGSALREPCNTPIANITRTTHARTPTYARTRGTCSPSARTHTRTSPRTNARAAHAHARSEEEFMTKLKAVDGTSLHETQEITFVKM
jgi:hypothetical protein